MTTINNNIKSIEDELTTITYEEIINDKKYTNEYLNKQYKKFKKMSVEKNKNTFICNKLIYNFFYQELLNTRRKTNITFNDLFHNDKDRYDKHLKSVIKSIL